MCAQLAGLGTFPHTGIIHVSETDLAGAGHAPSPARGPGVDHKWMGMLLAAAVPISSPALAQAQPADQTPVQTIRT